MHAVLSKIAKGVTVCYSEFFPNQNNVYFRFVYIGKVFFGCRFILYESCILQPKTRSKTIK
jgi:hypothetical protein